MRYFLLVLGVIVIAVMVVAGKRGDMSRRPPIEPRATAPSIGCWELRPSLKKLFAACGRNFG